MQPVSSIRNLGPASDAGFARAGIDSAQSLRALGADAAYTRLMAAGTKPHFIGYYALAMGLQGRPWNDCQGAEKAALRERFDALVAAHRAGPATQPDGPSADLLRALDDMGVRPARD